MKIPTFLFLLGTGLAFAQGGSLTPPPGSPAPTMKSLDQVEARTPLVDGANGVTVNPGTGGITISASGSYYLTQNLTVNVGNAISIIANFVTLDLNGFTITSTSSPAGGNGVFISGKCVTVLNGNISSGYDFGESSGPGFLNGISSNSTGPIKVSQVIVIGCSENGINLNDSASSLTSVDSCLVEGIGHTGIIANSITQSSVTNSKSAGIRGVTVNHSKVHSSGNVGINASLISNCHSYSGFLDAIQGELVNHSYGHSAFGTGITAACVSHSIGKTNEGNGIVAENIVSFSFGHTDSFPWDGFFGIKSPLGVSCDPSGNSGISSHHLTP